MKNFAIKFSISPKIAISHKNLGGGGLKKFFPTGLAGFLGGGLENFDV